jgi:hypothetical protein
MDGLEWLSERFFPSGYFVSFFPLISHQTTYSKKPPDPILRLELLLLLRRRNRKNASAPIMATPAIPPTVPPATVPALDFEPDGASAVVVGEGGETAPAAASG